MTESESGILTPEQIERIKARERKRNQRAREKSAQAAAQADTPEVFWKRNRNVADQAQIASLLERQEYVFSLLDNIRTVMEGRSPDAEFATDVEEEIKADIAKHGICQMEVVLLEFWKSPQKLEMLTQRGDATSTFARYGLITAVLGHRLSEWQSWLQSSGWKTLNCVCGSSTFISQAIADQYAKFNTPLKCQQCIKKAAKAAEETK